MSGMKPCPCCNGISWVYYRAFTTYVYCDKCGLRTKAYNTEAEAIEAWNTRHERTCREVNKYPDGGRCSECGTKIKRAIKNHRVVANYCCYCGAHVKEDTDAD